MQGHAERLVGSSKSSVPSVVRGSRSGTEIEKDDSEGGPRMASRSNAIGSLGRTSWSRGEPLGVEEHKVCQTPRSPRRPFTCRVLSLDTANDIDQG